MRPTSRHRRPHRPAAAILAIALVGLLGGCLAGADTMPKSGPGSFGPLHDVRVASHSEEDGFDRVVLEFNGAVPAWSVQYVGKPVLADPSGLPIALAGDYAVLLRMSPAAAHDDMGTATYTGPSRISVGTPEVTEVVAAGDFEAVLTWVVGTRHQVPFRVSTLTGPPRLVIDFAHG